MLFGGENRATGKGKGKGLTKSRLKLCFIDPKLPENVIFFNGLLCSYIMMLIKIILLFTLFHMGMVTHLHSDTLTCISFKYSVETQLIVILV